MAQYNLLRNSRVFISTEDSATPAFTESNCWEILTTSDFSFSQATENQEITVSEAGATPTRGQALFNTALNPVEWTLTTYARPYKIASGAGANVNEHRCLEAILWHGLVTSEVPNFANASATAVKASTTTSFGITFAESNVHKLTNLSIYIKADNVWYWIKKVQVNQAEIDFTIDTIGSITWTGFGTGMEKIAAPSLTSIIQLAGTTASATASRADYIINRYTTLSIDDGDGTPANPYLVPITGGTLTINNNITYITPENLGIVNTPVGSFTGARQISGNVTCYLNTDATESSGALLTDMLATTALSKVKNSYAVVLNMGGSSAPFITFSLPTAHLSIPTVQSDDVIGLSIDFFGQGSTGVTDTNEMTVTYTALTATTDTTHDF